MVGARACDYRSVRRQNRQKPEHQAHANAAGRNLLLFQRCAFIPLEFARTRQRLQGDKFGMYPAIAWALPPCRYRSSQRGTCSFALAAPNNSMSRSLVSPNHQDSIRGAGSAAWGAFHHLGGAGEDILWPRRQALSVRPDRRGHPRHACPRLDHSDDHRRHNSQFGVAGLFSFIRQCQIQNIRHEREIQQHPLTVTFELPRRRALG
jgi:hypothetical protein